MLSIENILETNRMIQDNKLDVRTITMGISLLGCISEDGGVCAHVFMTILRRKQNI